MKFRKFSIFNGKNIQNSCQTKLSIFSGTQKCKKNEKFLRGPGACLIFFQNGGGTPNPFTVSQMPFFRGVISKVCFFCKVSEGISKKSPWPPEANIFI
jgi:hypothetical protein